MSTPPWSPPPLVKASLALHGIALLAAVRPGRTRSAALALLGANHGMLCAAGMAPRSPLLGRVVHRIPVKPGAVRPPVALTFDDGPDPEVTPRLLDLLDAHAARATFFCIGRRVERYPDLAREIVARGHRVENHTYFHRHDFAFRLYRGLEEEISRADRVLTQVTGRRPTYFRAPAGMRNPFLDAVLHRLGLTLVAWSRRGFDTVDGDVERVLPRLVRGLAPGDVLLLHDGNSASDSRGRPVVLEAAERLLRLLDRRGMAGVSLPPGL